MEQYTGSYSSISTDIQNIVANDISLLEQYILMQTGENEWTAYINKVGTNKTREIIITRNANNYNSRYSVIRNDIENFDFTVNNEYYVYSNVGYGKSLDLPITETMTSYGITFISCMLMFIVVFQGWGFKWLRKKKH